MSFYEKKDVYRIHTVCHPIFGRHWHFVEEASRESFLNTEDLHNFFTNHPERCKDLIYNYELLGSLSNWKVNEGSVSCKDSRGNRVLFRLDCKERFWENSFMSLSGVETDELKHLL